MEAPPMHEPIEPPDPPGTKVERCPICDLGGWLEVVRCSCCSDWWLVCNWCESALGRLTPNTAPSRSERRSRRTVRS